MINVALLQGSSPASTTQHDLNLAFLQAELARIDILLSREFRRWVLTGQDPNDDYRGLYVTQNEVESLLARAPGTNWGDTAELPTEEEDLFQRTITDAVEQSNQIAKQICDLGATLRLHRLLDGFGLDRLAYDILLLCLAPALDTRYERIFGFLQDNVTLRRPTVQLILNLLGEPGLRKLALAKHLSQNASPLLHYELIERVVEATPSPPHLINQTLHIHETVVAWLLGQYQPHPILEGCSTLCQPIADATDNELTADVWPLLSIAVDRFDGSNSRTIHPTLALWGPDAARQNALVRRISAANGKELLTVDLSKVIGENCSPQRAVRLALRDARLTGAQPYLRGWDACLTEDGAPADGIMEEVCAFPGYVIVGGTRIWYADDLTRLRRVYAFQVPKPDYQERVMLWSHLVERAAGISAPLASAAELDVAGLAGQFSLTSAQIEHAVAAAWDQAEREGRRVGSDDLYEMARAVSNPQLGLLARKVTPRYTWEDLVLPADQVAILRELVDTVRGRPTVLMSWGVGKKLASSSGVTALFAGPPGTGKTMAAEVIAQTLGLELYKIDLSTVVSKYIGETEKNLERIFHEAATSNSILFFDEADAIFGKRSEVRDAHDRYANIEVSYLLQRMEAYDGVTILATNLRANLDDAFARRLQFAVDFPFPGQVERLHIWQTLFPPEVPRDASLDFGLLARRFELAGGNIRNIIMGAAYLAAADGGRVTMAHLMHSTRRELQKMGRLVDIEDFNANSHM